MEEGNAPRERRAAELRRMNIVELIGEYGHASGTEARMPLPPGSLRDGMVQAILNCKFLDPTAQFAKR